MLPNLEEVIMTAAMVFGQAENMDWRTRVRRQLVAWAISVSVFIGY